jgi:2-keto-4-pentenoate hydratase
MRQEVADILWEAQRSGRSVAPVTQGRALSVEDAYAIQRINVRRHQEAGARVLGHKVGLTSAAIQAWLKVDEPDFGTLMDFMLIPQGGSVDFGRMMQPRAEGELAFVLAEDLEGPSVTAVDVLQATSFVLPAIEVIDSRILDWNLTLEDTVADNASSGLFVLGSEPISVEQVDMQLVGMALRRRGRVVSTGAGLACMGNPVEAVAWLANKLSSLGQPLEAGQIILSGALGPAVPVQPGDWFEMTLGDLGQVSFQVEG